MSDDRALPEPEPMHPSDARDLEAGLAWEQALDEAEQRHALEVAESWGYVLGEDGEVEPVGEPARVPVPQRQRETFTPINRAARRKAERDARRAR